MTIYDISVAITGGMTVYPGDPQVVLQPERRIARGDDANITSFSMSSHCGTHIDPPRHFNDMGVSVDNLPLSLLIGPVLVADMTGIEAISRDDLGKISLSGVKRLILKTGNSRLWGAPEFCGNYSHLTEAGAAHLVESGIRLIGIDYLSIESFEGDGSVHRLLLDNGIVILEGLNMEGVPPGRYDLICLPLKIKDGDGAPARAVLVSRQTGHADGNKY